MNVAMKALLQNCKMQKHFCVKLLSKIPRTNASNISSNSISPRPIQGSFFQKFLYGHNGGVSESFQQNRFFSSSTLARRFFSNARRRKSPPVNGASETEIHAAANCPSPKSRYHVLKAILLQGGKSTNGVLIGLMGTNVAVYLLWQVANTKFMVENFMISVENLKNGRLYTLLITSELSHREIALWLFGSSIGRIYGAEYLLKLYLSGEAAGSIFHAVYHAFVAPLFRGASGAVNAIVLLYVFLFPHNIIYVNLVIPVPAALVVNLHRRLFITQDPFELKSSSSLTR